MKINVKRSLQAAKFHPWKIGAIITLIIGFFSPAAMANGFQQWTSSVLEQLKGNATIGGMFAEFSRISEEFNNDLKSATGLTDADISAIMGDLGQLDPTKAAEKFERAAAASSPLGEAMSHSSAAAAIAAKASDTVLSEDAQKFDKKTLENLLQTAEQSVTFANSVGETGAAAQSEESSQNILKALASQNTDQARISAAQAQMLLSVATDAQKAKMQAAATNEAMSEMLTNEQRKAQKQLITENEQSQASLISQYRNIVETGL
jgi:hypothetical protein